MSQGKMNARANAKFPIAKSMEIRDLNDEQGQAALQVKGKGRVSDQALEVLASAPATREAIETDVLYQRLGNTWYAFTQVNDEVYYSKVSEEQVAQARYQAASVDRVAALFEDRATTGKALSTDSDMDQMFHRAETRTGNPTRNGGGNA